MSWLDSHSRLAGWFAAIILVAVVTGSVAVADEVAAESDGAKPAEAGSADGEHEPDEAQQQRARTVEVGLWVLLGVVLLAGVALVGIVLFGGVARRRAREPLPNQTRDDAFWYLRRKDVPAGGTDAESETPEPDDGSTS